MTTKDNERWVSWGATPEEMRDEIEQHLQEIRDAYSSTIYYHIGELCRDNAKHPLLILHSLQEELLELAQMGGLPVNVAKTALDIKAEEVELS